MNWLQSQLTTAVLNPVRSLKKRYIPLLLIYFAYGASSFSTIALTFWEKENLTLSTEQLLMITVWVSTPWTIKMVFGQFVDAVPLFGNRRKSYIFLGAGLVALEALFLAGLATNASWAMWLGGEYQVYLTAALLGAIGFMVQDVTADTMSTEVVEREEQKNGKKTARKIEDVQADLAMVQVLGRLSFTIASVLVAGLGGVLAGAFTFEEVAWMKLIIPFISVIGAIFIKLDPHTGERSSLDPKILGGGIAFGVFSVWMAFSDFSYAQELVFGVSFVLLAFMLYWITKDSPRKQVKAIFLTLLAVFIYRAMPITGPGLSWWMIDDLGFDEVFFGVLRQAGAIVALLVLWLFSDFIAHKSVRAVFLFLIILGGFLNLPELMLYYDVHESLGVSARTVALIDSSLDDPMVHISMIPMLSIIAFYAPPTHRGTWFAVAASMMNLATTGSRLLTKYLNKIFIVTREVANEAGEVITNADYSQLGNLMITKTAMAFFIPLAAVLLFLKKKLR